MNYLPDTDLKGNSPLSRISRNASQRNRSIMKLRIIKRHPAVEPISEPLRNVSYWDAHDFRQSINFVGCFGGIKR